MTTNEPSPPETVEVALKACPNPWCASHRREETREAYAPYVKLFIGGYSRVVCAVCPQIGPSKLDPDSAIAAWNTRTTAESASCEALREALDEALLYAEHDSDCGANINLNIGCICGLTGVLDRARAAIAAVSGGVVSAKGKG